MSCPATPILKSQVPREVLLVSPATPAVNTLPETPRQRKRTPSCEESSAKKLALVTTPSGSKSIGETVQRSDFPSPMGWPEAAPQARIDAKVSLTYESLPDDQGSRPSYNQCYGNAKHIILPFEARSAFGSEEGTQLLKSVFPSNRGMGMDGVFLYYYFAAGDMPSKPWPKTVGGLPVYFAPIDDIDRSPKTLGVRVNPRNRRIDINADFRMVRDWTALFEAIRAHFEKLEIEITEVIYWGNYVNVVLGPGGREVDLARLPPKAANVAIFYFYDDEMGRPSDYQGRRISDPTPGNPDDSTYSALQPGVMLSSEYIRGEPGLSGLYRTATAGVLVKDMHGKEYMTVASHVFSNSIGAKVIHPIAGPGRVIGEVVATLTPIDIALVKLNENETFQNVTFENDDTPAPVPLKRFVMDKELQIGDGVLLDSADTGALAGVFLAQTRARVPADDPEEQLWIKGRWDYTGQDSANELRDGMRGSAIFNVEGDVVGFFRYAPKSGVMIDYCISVAAEELVDRGYMVADTSNRMLV